MVLLVEWAFAELLGYPVVVWATFAAVAAIAAFLFRGPGVLFGHFIASVLVCMADLQWVQAEMLKPGWAGQPDRDVVSMFGVIARVLLVNTALLPVSLLGLRLGRSVPRGRPSPDQTGRGFEVVPTPSDQPPADGTL